MLTLLLTPAAVVSPASTSVLRGVDLRVGNLRDLSATSLSSGRAMRPNAVLRSASPANMTHEDVRFMQHEIGLRSVLDLRAQAEGEKDVGARLLPQAAGVSTQFLSLFDEQMLRSELKSNAQRKPLMFAALVGLKLAKKLSPSRRLRAAAGREGDRRLIDMLDAIDLKEVYYWMATQRGDEIRRAFETCADPQQVPVLFHCTHGKDRTGVLAALLLHACGATEAAIVGDYAVSDAWGCSVEGRWLMQASMPPHVADRVYLDPWCCAPEAAMEGLFERLTREFGSVDGYLDSIGVDAELRERLVANLVE